MTLAFATSLVQEETPEVRIHAQQAIHIIWLREAGNEHEPCNLSDRCYALTFYPLIHLKLKNDYRGQIIKEVKVTET